MVPRSRTFFRSGGTADKETTVPLANALPLKPGVGQNIATDASNPARNFFLVPISAVLVHSPSFSPDPLPAFNCVLKASRRSLPCGLAE